MKRMSLLLAVILVSAASVYAESSGLNPVYQGFNGGMSVHGGYFFLQNQDGSLSTEGFSLGMGGKISFNIWSRLRIGQEGYSSRCRYDDSGSFFDLGWGGVSVELRHRFDRLQIAAGGIAGGGKIRHLQYISGNSADDSSDIVVYREQPVFLYSPTLSVEYFIKDNLALSLKADFLMSAPGKMGGGFTTGPRFYLGTMFSK